MTYSKKVLREILAAPGGRAVEEVILMSARLYEQKTNNRIVQAYLLNMVNELHSLKARELLTNERANVDVAIQTFIGLYESKT